MQITKEALNTAVAEGGALIAACRTEAAKRIQGQTEVIDGILSALIVGGHVLLEGVPGLAKTLAVRTIADIAALDFKRIQFTPDLLPADVSGTMIYEQASGTFSVRKGPVFANLVLADEINRAPAKVQSALLEAMAEKQVTIGDKTYALPDPFFVLATQNPIEQEGTYHLPEAELDRFLLKLAVPYPTPAQEVAVVKALSTGDISDVPVQQVLSAPLLHDLRNLITHITCDDKIIEYLVSLVTVTRPTAGENTRIVGAHLKYLAFGASPRASIALYQCAKVRALFAGRTFVLPEDVKSAAPAVLRHRLVLSYEAAAEGVTADDLISRILSLLPVP